MKKYLLKIALFFVLMAVIDVVCGWAFVLLRSKVRGGQTFKNEYINKTCSADILILGSSRADHHYVPEVFEDSLGLSCYNAGEMGCGIIPAYVRYKMVSYRHKPKLVIYEVTPEYDYLEENSYSSQLGVIRQYTSDRIVRSVYVDFSDKLERLRLLSNSYRNNSKIVTNVKDLIAQPDPYKGYEPLFGHYYPNQRVSNTTANDIQIDSLKFAYVEKLICDIGNDNVPLVFMISPRYYETSSFDRFEPAFKLCGKYEIPLFNNLNYEGISGKEEFFQDDGHLNDKGARLYSHCVLSQIRNYIN